MHPPFNFNGSSFNRLRRCIGFAPILSLCFDGTLLADEPPASLLSAYPLKERGPPQALSLTIAYQSTCHPFQATDVVGSENRRTHRQSKP